MKGMQAGTSEDLWSLLGVDSWLEPLSPALVWAGPAWAWWTDGSLPLPSTLCAQPR